MKRGDLLWIEMNFYLENHTKRQGREKKREEERKEKGGDKKRRKERKK